MTDEEKKAIKDIKRIINNPEFDYIVLMDCQGFTEWNDIFKTLLTAYEKQQKEIEELKKYKEGYKLLSYSLDNYTSNDKIKAKIEVLEKLQKEFPNNDEIRIKIIAYKELLEKE